MDSLNLENTEVAVIRGNNPKESVLNGIEKLGGISKFINIDEQVFIKFNLRLPYGFPTNTNFNVLKAVIQSCNKVGAKKVYIGSFPFKGITIKSIYDILGLNNFLKDLGAEFTFLDNSNLFYEKRLNFNKLKFIKKHSFSTIKINNKTFLVPKVILESDKFISINQVNVDPLFKCSLSLLNSYSIVPNKYQEIKKISKEGKDYFLLDQHKQDLISNIIDVFTIKKPNLVINDLFYILEGAGPYIYKDSNLKKTGIVIIGNDAVAVDTITLKILNLDKNKNDLLLKAIERRLGVSDTSKINIIGEKLENINIHIEQCVSKLKNINLMNISIEAGKFCSGCFKQAYHLLNFMKTNMTKDLKYISKTSFLVGEKPLDLNNSYKDNIILFGDCSINSTKDLSFRFKLKASKKKPRVKVNKKVLELHGCPPDIFNCIEMMIKFYGKNNVPNLNLLDKLNKYYIPQKVKKKLEKWEEL